MIKKFIRALVLKVGKILIPDLYLLEEFKKELHQQVLNSVLEEPLKIYSPCRIVDSKVGKYSYISEGAKISYTDIGRFCSIGPGLLCGWGIHPSDGISTSPMFYSTQKQNGFSLSPIDKIKERKKISIGNDVFVGANVTILDGITIGNGAIIGAGCIVSKDVPSYSIVVGVPMRILSFRFTHEMINEMLKIQWWNWPEQDLSNIEKSFFQVEEFIEKYK